MKNISTRILCAVASVGLLLSASVPAPADDRIVTTTTTAGTISEFSPDTIVVRSTTSPEPLRYGYTRETTYVDETGAPVSIEAIRSGLPVTVHYVREGPRILARKVIVHRAAPVVEERTTTTTTTRELDDDDDDDDDDFEYEDD
jgi:hypothetical protein